MVQALLLQPTFLFVETTLMLQGILLPVYFSPCTLLELRKGLLPLQLSGFGEGLL